MDNIIIGQKISSDKLQRAKKLRRQQIIDGFIVDFYCHGAKLVIEIDEEIHQKQIEYDAERDKILSARGLRLLRIKNDEVKENLDKVLRRITLACET